MNNDFELHNNTIDIQMKKYNSVTIIGLENGLGTEIVKNLVLYV
jgi:wobble nucleotide-excising tRNase